MGKSHGLRLSKGQDIQYMDVKYLSECIDMERRHVRIKIYEWRQKRRAIEALKTSPRPILKIMKGRWHIYRAFQRYSLTTRLYHQTRRDYLTQLSQRY